MPITQTPSRAAPTSANPTATTILLNWNGCADTLACLAALRTTGHSLRSIVVVDNASTDNSANRIRTAYPKVRLIELGRNLGFAGGNNYGIRYALESGSDYVWLLNNDSEPQSGALEAMLAVAQSDPQIAAVGCVLRHAEPPHAVQSWGGGRIALWAGFNTVARKPRPSDWFDYICAGSMLVRREALLDIGLLDDGYFLYWEDADFGFRLRHEGWKLAVASDAVVLHKENGSTAGNSPVRDRHSTASCLRFLHAWSPTPSLASAIFLFNRLARRVLLGQFRRVGAVLKGIRDSRAPVSAQTEQSWLR